jgi:hypothetical protein
MNVKFAKQDNRNSCDEKAIAKVETANFLFENATGAHPIMIQAVLSE